MFPTIKEVDHNKVTLWPYIPCSTSPTIKEVNARIQSLFNDDHGKEKDSTIKEVDTPTQTFYNEDHGKAITFIYVLM